MEGYLWIFSRPRATLQERVLWWRVFSGLASSFITERDPSVHAKLRKTLLTAFSDRSLKEQEYLIDEGRG